jgi:hypothetical protein
LLDRFFSSVDWYNHFNNYLVRALPLIQSDHTPLILSTIHIFNSHFQIKLKKIWLQQDRFKDLFTIWWNFFIILVDFGEKWRLKLHFIRKKLRGWSLNLRASKKR